MAAHQVRHLRAWPAPFRTAAIFPPAAICLAAFANACAPPLDLPAALGNCDPGDATSCSTPVTGGGSVTTPDATSQNESDGAVLITEGVEGGSCGMADTMIMAPCGPCIVEQCCQADALCSKDDGCLSLVNCVVNNTPCSTLTQMSTVDYDDLALCFTQNCSAQCLTLSGRDF
jgi:hypothetical protein